MTETATTSQIRQGAGIVDLIVNGAIAATATRQYKSRGAAASGWTITPSLELEASNRAGSLKDSTAVYLTKAAVVARLTRFATELDAAEEKLAAAQQAEQQAAPFVAAEWTDTQDGTVVRGTVVKQNGSSIYVLWQESGRTQRIARPRRGSSVTDMPAGEVVFFTAAQMKPKFDEARRECFRAGFPWISRSDEQRAIELAHDERPGLVVNGQHTLTWYYTVAAKLRERMAEIDAEVGSLRIGDKVTHVAQPGRVWTVRSVRAGNDGDIWLSVLGTAEDGTEVGSGGRARGYTLAARSEAATGRPTAAEIVAAQQQVDDVTVTDAEVAVMAIVFMEPTTRTGLIGDGARATHIDHLIGVGLIASGGRRNAYQITQLGQTLLFAEDPDRYAAMLACLAAGAVDGVRHAERELLGASVRTLSTGEAGTIVRLDSDGVPVVDLAGAGEQRVTLRDLKILPADTLAALREKLGAPGPIDLAALNTALHADPSDVLSNVNALVALVRNRPADALRYVVQVNLSRPGRDAAVRDAVLELADLVDSGSVAPLDAARRLDEMAQRQTRCKHTASDCRAAARGIRVAHRASGQALHAGAAS